MQRLDLNLLRVFAALLRERNVTKAAKHLNLTQSATSSALARLRETFNDQLFIPTGKGLVTTARAQALAGPITSALQQIDAAASSFDEFNPAKSGYHFRLRSPEHVTALLLPKLMPLLRQEAPSVTLDLQPSPGTDASESLRTGELDFLIAYVFEPPPENFRMLRLYRETSVTIASRRYRDETSPLTLEDYVNARHVVLRPSQTWRYSPIDHALQKLGYSRKVAVSVASHLMAVDIVRHSDLISSVPQSVTQNLVDPEQIVTYASPVPVAHFDVSVIWHEREHQNPAHKWFRTLLKRCRDLG